MVVSRAHAHAHSRTYAHPRARTHMHARTHAHAHVLYMVPTRHDPVTYT